MQCNLSKNQIAIYNHLNEEELEILKKKKTVIFFCVSLLLFNITVITYFLYGTEGVTIPFPYNMMIVFGISFFTIVCLQTVIEHYSIIFTNIAAFVRLLLSKNVTSVIIENHSIQIGYKMQNGFEKNKSFKFNDECMHVTKDELAKRCEIHLWINHINIRIPEKW